MKKIILLTAIALSSFAAATNAQEKGGFKLGVGPVAALPMGDFGDFYSFGVGGEVQASYGITDNIAGFAQVGYSQYFAKSVDFGGGISIKGEATGMIPALVGARYHTSGFMVGAGIGYAKLTAEDAGGGFAYSPQIGYSFADGKLDVIAHYTGVATSDISTSMVGLKIFFNFLNK
jgi:hypothetical protein